MQEINKIIERKIRQILRENANALAHGKMDIYTNNCNQLKGIEFVKNLLR